jgi:phytoene dehydrogenase-like protein
MASNGCQRRRHSHIRWMMAASRSCRGGSRTCPRRWAPTGGAGFGCSDRSSSATPDFFDNILRPIRMPRHPWLMARFGKVGLQSCVRLQRQFADAPARALLAGSAAHSFLPLSAPGSASFGLVLAVAGHAVDWPCARAGSQRIVEALASIARAAGCAIETNRPVHTLADVPRARAVLFDLTPRQLLEVASDALSASYRRHLRRFAYGPGVFKIDYALAEPIPWRAPACATAATVHVGGTADEIARSEAAVNAGAAPDAPFVLIAQQSQMDHSRAPRPRHTGWAYCHVPHASGVDMTERVEAQIERFAPGFRDVILARHVITPAALQAHNPNMIGGDIGGGANTLRQFLLRPAPRWDPYTTSNPRLFLCSSSTPPGGGVHGMCGYWAARTVLRRIFRRGLPEDLITPSPPSGAPAPICIHSESRSQVLIADITVPPRQTHRAAR